MDKVKLTEIVANRVNKVLQRPAKRLGDPLAFIAMICGDQVKPSTAEKLILTAVTALIVEGHLILKETDGGLNG